MIHVFVVPDLASRKCPGHVNTRHPSRMLHRAFGPGQVLVSVRHKWTICENITNCGKLPRARKFSRTRHNFQELGEYGMHSSGLQQNILLGSCEHGNEKTGSLKVRKFLEHLRDLQVPKDGCAPWSLLGWGVGHAASAGWWDCRPHWPRGLRYELPSLARKLGSWVRIPLKSSMSVLCACVPWMCCSVVRQRPCNGLIPAQGVLPTLYRIKKLKKPLRPTRAVVL
jgi:hypothetical protein